MPRIQAGKGELGALRRRHDVLALALLEQGRGFARRLRPDADLSNDVYGIMRPRIPGDRSA